MTLRYGQIGTCLDCSGHVLPGEACRRCGAVAPEPAPGPDPRPAPRHPDASAPTGLTDEHIETGRRWVGAIRSELRAARRERSGLRGL